MKPTYAARIILRDPQGRETELARFNRAISNYDRRAWLAGLSEDWEVIEETTQPKLWQYFEVPKLKHIEAYT